MENCLICGDKCDSSSKAVVKKPTKKGLFKLVECAEIRKDEFSKNILAQKNSILANSTNFQFHVSCRNSYISANNIKNSPLPSLDEPTTSTQYNLKPKTRGESLNFNVRQMCLFCKRTGLKKKEKLTSIQTGAGKSTRENILKAAEKRADTDMIALLANYEDLFAYDAKYHKSCYAHYISERNIQAVTKNFNTDQKSGKTDKAFMKIQSYVQNHIIENHETVSLTKLLEQYNVQAELFDQSAIQSKKLKNMLKNTFGRKLEFCSRPGKTDIIHVPKINVGDYLLPVDHSSSSSEDEIPQHCNLSDKQILRRAAKILRNSMQNFKGVSKTFPSPAGITFADFKTQVSDTLLSFITWLLEKEENEGDDDTGVLTLANIIMGFYSKEFYQNNLQLGLGLFVYHTVRSKKVIDLLHTMGFSCSYNDVRRLLTSVAKCNLKTENNGVFIPYGLERVDDVKKNYIHASIDNFDVNEDTLDGRGSTHSMALVVFQEASEDSQFTDIVVPKDSKLTLDANETDVSFQKVEKYYKPRVRPEPKRMTSFSYVYEPQDVNLLWKLLRYKEKEKPFLGWTEYHNVISDNNIRVSNIAYLPFINNPPTEFDTIYTSMLRLVQLAEHLNQKHIVITADLAIYSKAQEILWNRPPDLDGKVTMQLGGMHLTMAFIASIGFLYKDGGLSNMLTDTNVYAYNSCQHMLDGKQYSRAIRGLTLCADALSRLLFHSLEKWLEENNNEEYLKIFSNFVSEQLKVEEFNKLTYNKIVKTLTPIKHILKEFEEKGSRSSPTFNYWLTFLKAVDLLLDLHKAERNGEFEVHLNCVYATLPYIIAAGRHQYAKWIPIYLKDMADLKENNQDMYEYFRNGNFIVKKTMEKKFNCVASDMALEQSINRDCKSASGVIGFTQKRSALLRWITTRHVVGLYSHNFEELFLNNGNTSRKEGLTLRNRNEEDVLKILTHIKYEWACNPFDLNEASVCLVNIATGRIASNEIEKSLLNFVAQCKTKGDNFIEKVITNGSQSFWEPVKKEKILTFAENKSKHAASAKQYIGSEMMFRRIVAAAKFQNFDLSNLLSYELTSVPLSLFHEDGNMRKTTKSDLIKKLVPYSSVINPQAVNSILIDGMVLVQELNEKMLSTFADLALSYLRYVLSISRKLKAKRITIVFDKYGNCIKSMERDRRGDCRNIHTYEVAGNRKIIKFREFLKLSDNKRSLLKFLSEYLLANGSKELEDDEILIIAGGFENPNLCYSVNKNGRSEMTELSSNHEEADTRLIFHALYEFEVAEQNSVLVKSVDTDVLILLIYYYYSRPDLSRNLLLIELGHGSKKQILSVSEITKKLKSTCLCLSALHALTGCDTTSALYKVGKKTAFDILIKNIKEFQNLETLPTVSIHEAFKIATKFILALFKNKHKNIETLNDFRLELTLHSNKSASEIPPTDDALQQHVLRCIYQLNIWMNSHVANIPYLDPENYGWKVNNGAFDPTFMKQEPIPEDVREVLTLFCKDKSCENSKCVCLKEGLKCCSNCSCKNCCNVPIVYDSEEDDI